MSETIPETHVSNEHMAINPNNIPRVQEIGDRIEYLKAERKLHVPDGIAEPISSTEEITSELDPILEMIADAFKQKK